MIFRFQKKINLKKPQINQEFLLISSLQNIYKTCFCFLKCDGFSGTELFFKSHLDPLSLEGSKHKQIYWIYLCCFCTISVNQRKCRFYNVKIDLKFCYLKYRLSINSRSLSASKTTFKSFESKRTLSDFRDTGMPSLLYLISEV